MTTPDRFGNYVLEERIASGGMAEVFRARREGAAGFTRRVCIKRILPNLRDAHDFANMFIDEARTGSLLRHGNIVAVEDFGEVSGQYFLCMEYVAGVDLSRLLQKLRQAGERVSLDVFTHVATELLRALDYAHRKLGDDGQPLRIVHRDVSPQNALVAWSGEIKLADFGIARAASRLHQTTGRTVKGKLAYMAPEQARGEVVDARADLFALGVVLFETLAGQRPFQAVNEMLLLHAVAEGNRRPLSAFRTDLPDAVVTLVDRLLEPNRDARLGSAGEGLVLLAPLASGRGARETAALMARFFPECAPGGQPSRLEGTAETEPTVVETAPTEPALARVNEHAATTRPSTAVEEATVPARPVRAPVPRSVPTWSLIAAAVALAVAAVLAYVALH